MKKEVHRGAVGIGAQEKHLIPRGAQIIHVDMRQHDAVDFWYEFEVDNWVNRETRLFQVHGTGHPMNGTGTHVGTALSPEEREARRMPRGAYVWHLYEYPYEEGDL